MSAFSRRLDRLEERFGLVGQGKPMVESWEMRYRRERLEAARLRVDSPPISPERRAELKGKTVVDILRSARRQAAAECHDELGTTVPGV